MLKTLVADAGHAKLKMVQLAANAGNVSVVSCSIRSIALLVLV